ncbi:MAG: amino acid synthesis family protein, partial [Pseudomonadota bacterium]
MITEIRRTLLHIQTTHIEEGRSVEEPTKLIAALAIIANPWHGRGFVEDLSPEVKEVGPVVGRLLTEM